MRSKLKIILIIFIYNVKFFKISKLYRILFPKLGILSQLTTVFAVASDGVVFLIPTGYIKVFQRLSIR